MTQSVSFIVFSHASDVDVYQRSDKQLEGHDLRETTRVHFFWSVHFSVCSYAPDAAVHQRSDQHVEGHDLSIVFSQKTPSIYISLLLKSAPIVGLKFSVNLLCSNIWIKEVFPTPESPIATTFTKHFFSPLFMDGDAPTERDPPAIFVYIF